MENNKIYVGDTLRTLKEFPDNFFDITVTSPPYNKMKAAGGLVKEVKYKNSTDNYDETDYQVEQVAVLNELYRVTKQGGHVFYNHKLRWVDGGMIHPMEWIMDSDWYKDIRQEIIWDRGIAGNLRGWRFWQIEERIYWMQKGLVKGEELLSKHAKMTSIWKIRPDSNSVHPAPFPIEIPTRCIYSIADLRKSLNILDPYCGGGTTLSAARNLGHNYVGIDISSEYATLAEERLKIDKDDTRICAEVDLHVVKKSYKDRKKK
jgi:site-specific DNA-methyltransferase (adenine-specific)